MRTSRTVTTVFSLEGFIKDFVDFYERPFKRGETTVLPKDSGFTERVLRMKAQKFENIRLRKVMSDDPQLEPASIDAILMIDAIHYVKDRVSYAKKLRAGLAPDGRLVIIDYLAKPMSERPWGPPPEQ